MKIPASPPPIEAIQARSAEFLVPHDALWREVGRGAAPEGRYRHWDTLRRIPSSTLPKEGIWFARKMARRALYRPIPLLLDLGGEPFQYALVDPVLERLHRIDREAAGQIGLAQPATRVETREHYIARSLEEEAITSSQLEGAVTTRKVAKEMIRSGRSPRNRSEQMILNNYHVMQHVRERLEEPLTPALVLDLHRIVTAKTLEAGEGPLRTLGDGIAVFDDQDNELHRPPPADQIVIRLQRMCRFAEESEAGIFLHPVIKSIVLHFWLAYDHPFVDGNGRTARALFYWSMLREGFWLAEYISISRVLKKAPARYARSFLYTETDDNDLTYFLLAQLRVIEQAIADLKIYLERTMVEMREVSTLIEPAHGSGLNERQRDLIAHALNHTESAYTIAWHKQTQKVAYATARADLLDLAERGLLEQQKRGKKFVFIAPADLADRLRAL